MTVRWCLLHFLVNATVISFNLENLSPSARRGHKQYSLEAFYIEQCCTYDLLNDPSELAN